MISLHIMIEKVLFLEFYVEFYFQSNHVVLDGHIFSLCFKKYMRHGMFWIIALRDFYNLAYSLAVEALHFSKICHL